MKTDSENPSGESNDLSSSGKNITFWIDSVDPIRFEPLKKNIDTEVIIVGGGIAGITIAYSLVKEGKKVVLIDDGYIGSGESGRTTAHIVNALDDRYTELERYHGKEGAKLAAESHTSAIEFIKYVVRKEKIDCDFSMLDGYLFLHPSDKRASLEDELLATHRAGMHTELLSKVPGIPLEDSPCLKFPDQAQFHPMKYLQGLTDVIIRLGGEIYTETHASEIKEGFVKANGYDIQAEHVVVATNTPVNDLVTMHTKQYPYRTYVIAARIPRSAVKQPALWWDTGDQDSRWITMPYHYVRLQNYDEQSYLLIAGGEDHKTGQADEENIPEENRYAALEDWLRKRFPAMEEIVYRWSGQVMEPLDSLAYIGRNPGSKNIYIVTGDSGNGMTHGTIAGILIPDLISGRKNRWEKLYDPSRINLKITPDYISEAANMAAQYADFFSRSEVKELEKLPPGEGAIINSNLKKVAVYRSEGGKLYTFSAVCPHLGCVLQWNSEEKSFDCPCHGSRFTCDGKVVNGPAISNMGKIRLHYPEIRSDLPLNEP